MDQPELSKAVIKSIPLSESLDSLQEFAEISLDNIIESDVLKEVPIVKTIISIFKTTVSLQDRILLKKILSFLAGLDNISHAEKQKFVKRLEEEPDFEKKVGNSLLLILDKYDNYDKPKILARVFSAFMNGKITFDEYQKYAQSIDKSFIGYLNKLKEYYDSNLYGIDDYILQNLYNSGFVSLTLGANNAVSFVKNKFGKQFINLIFMPDAASTIPLIIPSFNDYENSIFKILSEESIKKYPDYIRVVDELKEFLADMDEMKFILYKLKGLGYVEIRETLAFQGSTIKLLPKGFDLYFNECYENKREALSTVAKTLLNNGNDSFSRQIAEANSLPQKIVNHIIELLASENILRVQATNIGYIINEVIGKNALKKYII